MTIRSPRRRSPHWVMLHAACVALAACAVEAPAEEGRPGKPPPPAPEMPVSGTDSSGVQTQTPESIDGARVIGTIPGLSVSVVSTYAYRDWMPRMGGPKGEDGGSPLHVAIGLLLTNTGSEPLSLSRRAELGATGTPLSPEALDDLAGTLAWPLELAPGSQQRLQIGTRDGPYFPVGEALDIEITLTDRTGASVRISVADLPVGRTD